MKVARTLQMCRKSLTVQWCFCIDDVLSAAAELSKLATNVSKSSARATLKVKLRFTVQQHNALLLF
jgi:hypothetical protein